MGSKIKNMELDMELDMVLGAKQMENYETKLHKKSKEVTREKEYFHFKIVNGENNEKKYIPYIMGEKFPGVNTQEEMMQIIRAVEKLDKTIIEVVLSNGEDDYFYVKEQPSDLITAKRGNPHSLYIDNKLKFFSGNKLLGHIFDTEVLSHEGLQKLIPGKDTSFYNQFLDAYKKVLNKKYFK